MAALPVFGLVFKPLPWRDNTISFLQGRHSNAVMVLLSTLLGPLSLSLLILPCYPDRPILLFLSSMSDACIPRLVHLLSSWQCETMLIFSCWLEAPLTLGRGCAGQCVRRAMPFSAGNCSPVDSLELWLRHLHGFVCLIHDSHCTVAVMSCDFAHNVTGRTK